MTREATGGKPGAGGPGVQAKRPGPGAPRSILVRGPNWAGDLVMATPGFRALRSGFPDSHIALHLRPGLEALLAGAPWFDEVLPVRSYHRGARALWREARDLRERRFELGLCLPDSIASALLMRAAGVSRVVGYAGSGRRTLLHSAVPFPVGAGEYMAREHHVLGLVAALGCEPRGMGLELFVTPREQERAEELLTKVGISPQSRFVAMAPGASYGPSKCWPPEYWARLADQLASETAVVLVGAPTERERAARVRGSAVAPPADLTGELDLGTLKAVLRRAGTLVCNDAGARHVAVAFGIPCVVLMGPTSLDKTGENLERVSVLTADVDCRPCYLRECPSDHRCMTRISPARVAAAARAALAASA